MKKDYYSILGLSENATQSEIKAAYRKLALKFHPDKNPGDPFFERMFREVKEAYEILSDENKRKEYDVEYEYTSEDGSFSNSNQSNQEGYSPIELVNNIINNLNKTITEIKGAPSIQINSSAISEYLQKILADDILELYFYIPDKLKNEFIFKVIPLLRFIKKMERDKYTIQLVKIAGADNVLISNINEKVKSEIRKQNLKDSTNFFLRHWRAVGAILFIILIYYSASDTTNSNIPNKTRDVIIDTEPELYQKPPSKWKNNQLNTGDSPYNNYFGRGIYNKSYENRIKIHNGQSTDVIVCLTEYYQPHRTIRNEYIRAGESFEMTSIPSGTYYLKSFFGRYWNPDSILFSNVKGCFDTLAGFTKSDDYDDLLILEQTRTQYSIYEITLYPVVGGNMESEPINVSEYFEKD